MGGALLNEILAKVPMRRMGRSRRNRGSGGLDVFGQGIVYSRAQRTSSTADTTRLDVAIRGGLSRGLAQQFIQADIGLARRADMTDSKHRRKTIFHQPDFLNADHRLHPSGMMKPADGAQTWRIWPKVKSRR